MNRVHEYGEPQNSNDSGLKHKPVYIHKISECQRILEVERRDAIIKRVHDPTKDNGCAKYQYDALNIVSCRAVRKAGPTH